MNIRSVAVIGIAVLISGSTAAKADEVEVSARRIKAGFDTKVIVIAGIRNLTEALIDRVHIGCTVFDANHEPLGVGTTTVERIPPKDTVFDEAYVDIDQHRGPEGLSAVCRPDER